MKKYKGKLLLATVAVGIMASTALATSEETVKYEPRDGVINLYGAGGPHTALIRVGKLFTEKTGIKVNSITPGKYFLVPDVAESGEKLLVSPVIRNTHRWMGKTHNQLGFQVYGMGIKRQIRCTRGEKHTKRTLASVGPANT